MRTYDQLCPLAKALDVVGDRWSLLLVRELILRGPCRYTDLRHGLPGIATNLLADRLRELEAAGVVRRELAPPPVATTLFHLTARGQELQPALEALVRWGFPLLEQASEDDVFRGHWLAWPLQYLKDHQPTAAPVAITINAGEQQVIIETVEGRIQLRRAARTDTDAVLSGPPREVVAVLLGQHTVREAARRGVRYEGPRAVLARMQPRAVAQR